MRLRTPASRAVYVTARAASGGSKTITLYDTTPEEVIEALLQYVKRRSKSASNRAKSA